MQVVDALTDIIEGSAIRQCSPSKTCNAIDAIQPQKDIKIKDNNEKQNLSNNNKSKSEKVTTLVKETERKQCSERSIEVRRVGFKSNGTKSMRKNKVLYDEMIL